MNLFSTLALCLMLLLPNVADGRTRKQNRKQTKTQSSQIKKVRPRVDAGMNGELSINTPVIEHGYFDSHNPNTVAGAVNNAVVKQQREEIREQHEANKQQPPANQVHKHVKTCLKCTKEKLGNNRVSATFENQCPAKKPITFKISNQSEETEVTIYPKENQKGGIWISKEHNIIFQDGIIHVSMKN